VRTYCMPHITCMSVRAVCVAFVLSPLLPVPTYLPTDQPLSPLQLPYTCTHGARSAARSARHSNCSVFMDTHVLGYVTRVATGSWQRHTRPRQGTGASSDDLCHDRRLPMHPRASLLLRYCMWARLLSAPPVQNRRAVDCCEIPRPDLFSIYRRLIFVAQPAPTPKTTHDADDDSPHTVGDPCSLLFQLSA
jgi:hypothetical protein